MNALLLSLVLITGSDLLPSDGGASGRPVMRIVKKATPQGKLTFDGGEPASLAGVRVTNGAKAAAFFKRFVVDRPVKLEFEPRTKTVHVFVSADCSDVDKLLGKKPTQQAGSCVASVYVNEVLLQQKWAAAAPQGVTLYREKLFGGSQARGKKRSR